MKMTRHPNSIPGAIRDINQLVPGKVYQRHHKDFSLGTFTLVGVHYMEAGQELPYKTSPHEPKCSLSSWRALVVNKYGPGWIYLADAGVVPYKSGWNPWNYLTEVTEPAPKPKIEPAVTLKLSDDELQVLIAGTISLKRKVASVIAAANSEEEMQTMIGVLGRVDAVAKMLESAK